MQTDQTPSPMRDAWTAPRRISILDIPVDAVDMAGAVAFANHAVKTRSSPASILAVNPEKVMTLPQDPWLRDFFRGGDLLIPDGIGVVWAARVLEQARLERVPGADLMERLCALAARNGFPIFLFGATEEVNATAARVLQDRYPKLRIAGRANGYIRDRQADQLVESINASGAKILFVALGSPRQERWIAEHAGSLCVNVIQGIGGTLDTIAGRVKRAPKSWQRVHLEWLFRLIKDPRRIRRQSLLPLFAWRVLRWKFGTAR